MTLAAWWIRPGPCGSGLTRYPVFFFLVFKDTHSNITPERDLEGECRKSHIGILGFVRHFKYVPSLGDPGKTKSGRDQSPVSFLVGLLKK